VNYGLDWLRELNRPQWYIRCKQSVLSEHMLSEGLKSLLDALVEYLIIIHERVREASPRQRASGTKRRE